MNTDERGLGIGKMKSDLAFGHRRVDSLVLISPSESVSIRVHQWQKLFPVSVAIRIAESGVHHGRC